MLSSHPALGPARFASDSRPQRPAAPPLGAVSPLLRPAPLLPRAQVHATLKTAADYEAYLADAIPSLPPEAIKVGGQPLVNDMPRARLPPFPPMPSELLHLPPSNGTARDEHLAKVPSACHGPSQRAGRRGANA